MTITQRFLLLFSDFRETRDTLQRAQDEVLTLRAQCAALQTRYDDLVSKWLDREQEMTDRMMRIRHGVKSTLSPEEIASTVSELSGQHRRPESIDARTWKRKQTQSAYEALEAFSQKVSGQ